jgi:hypothetical protein
VGWLFEFGWVWLVWVGWWCWVWLVEWVGLMGEFGWLVGWQVVASSTAIWMRDTTRNKMFACQLSADSPTQRQPDHGGERAIKDTPDGEV